MNRARQYNQELFEYALNTNSQFKPQIAQIADEKSAVETLQQQKFTQEGTGIILRRYKIRICSMHDDTVPVEDLPWAYGQSPTSGLRGESSGVPIYPANTFVTVFQDSDTGIYYIDDVHPNSVGILTSSKAPGCSAASGFVPGSALFYVPQTHYKEGRLVEGAEWFNIPRPSQEDEKQDNLNEPIVLPSKCRKVNTEEVNNEITKLIKQVQGLKSGLTGKDSFLQTSQNFISSVQTAVNNASAKISNSFTWLIQQIRTYVMRRVNKKIGDLVGNVPLSSRYLFNETKNKTLSIISCLFIKLLQNLESIIAQILNALIDKLVNTAECLIENFYAVFIGQIVSQLTAAINGALGEISSLIGSVISFTNEILDFVISILDFLTCKVENVCPTTETWNMLEGGQPAKFNLNFNRIFESAKSVVDNFKGVINIPENIADFNFNFTSPSDILKSCGINPESCGPPNVIFWGGSGSGAKGNAVINSVGDIIGVDIVLPGNYTKAPIINFEDNCGKGRGAFGKAILGPITFPISIPSLPTLPGVGNTTPAPVIGIGTTIPESGTGTGTTTPAAGTGTTTPAAGIGTTTPAAGIGTTTGVVGVLMDKTGYEYLPQPDGSKGGMGRVWADRCQTIVRRANGNWDPPYSYEQPIKLFYGDMIQLPGKEEVYINCDFNQSKLPGCIVTGTLTCLKSMEGFDDGKGSTFAVPKLKSMVGFDDLRGSSKENTPPIPVEHQREVDKLVNEGGGREALANETPTANSYRPDQFGYVNDYPYAKELGFTDQDIRFYLEGFYSKLLGKKIGPLMQLKLDDPNFGPLPKYVTGRGGAGVFDYQNDYPYAVSLGFTDQDIRYYLENLYTGEIEEEMQKRLDDPNWGRIPQFYVTITAPDCPPQNPPKNNYDVTSSIGSVYVDDGGFGFVDGDTATVLDCSGNPDSVAKVELVIVGGTIVDVKVINPGTNFDCIPEIQINTKTGYNARLIPILRFTRALDVPPATKVISVVDCVGKV